MLKKKLYKKPKVKKIMLKTDEQVLGACKYTDTLPPASGATLGCIGPEGDCVAISPG